VARGVATGRLAPADELVALRLLDLARQSWVTRELTGPVLERAAAQFPSEPVRTLDAFHLATAALFHEALGGVTVLSLDDRIRDNARALGMEVGP
jgi:predicted nucleic acid-binding protein